MSLKFRWITRKKFHKIQVKRESMLKLAVKKFSTSGYLESRDLSKNQKFLHLSGFCLIENSETIDLSSNIIFA